MDAITNFFGNIFWLLIIFLGFVFWRYNGLRRSSEDVKEAWSNIGVIVRKQASLINQLIDAVRSYAENEKLVMLKVSADTSLSDVQQIQHQSSHVLTAVNGLAQRFPNLKANVQYINLMNAIQDVENKLERQRQIYNGSAKAFNIRRTSVPDLFYAAILGFSKPAPYLNFDGESEEQQLNLKEFANDDGERLNQLLSNASNKVLQVSQQLASVAQEKVKSLQDARFLQRELQLLYLDGEAEQRFGLKREGQVIGSSDAADIVVDDPSVAERHAWVGWEEERWMLRDLSDSRGMFINDDMETPIREIEFRPGIVISLGKHGGARFKVTEASQS